MRNSRSNFIVILTIIVVLIGVALYIYEEEIWLDDTGMEEQQEGSLPTGLPPIIT